MKKLISLTVALLLVITAVFSLSSCLVRLNDILNYTDGQTDTGNNDGSGNTGDGSGASDGSSGGVTGGVNGESNPDSGAAEGNGGEDNTEDGGNTEDSGNAEEGGDTSGGEGTQEGEGGIEFLPESGGEAGISSPDKALLSVVAVTSTFEAAYGRTAGSVGSGIIYKLDRQSGDAYIITNYHVVYNRAASNDGISDDINLFLYGMELSDYKIPATFVGGSLTQDLAVLKVEGSEVLKNSYARAADLGDSDAVAVMDPVIVIGNPEGYGISVTTGIVSVDSETLEMVGADGYTELDLRVLRIDAAVNEGNSGGGLFDGDGNLIGIVNAKRTGSDVDNMAYAIPLSYAKNFAENIIYYCDGEENRTASKCLLGVTVTNAVIGLVPDPDSGKLIRSELVEVAELTDNSILKDELSVGDRLTSVTVDGVKKDITRVHHLIDHVLTARVGSTVTINGTRNGEAFSITVTVPESALTSVR